MKEIVFYLEQSNHCCGIFEAGNFEAKGMAWGSRTPPPDFTEEEVYKKFIAQLQEDLGVQTSDGGKHRGHYLVRASLLTSGTSDYAQYQQLVAKLLAEHKWKTELTFINSNTGNEVTCFSKKISSRALKKYRPSDDDNDF